MKRIKAPAQVSMVVIPGDQYPEQSDIFCFLMREAKRLSSVVLENVGEIENNGETEADETK